MAVIVVRSRGRVIRFYIASKDVRLVPIISVWWANKETEPLLKLCNFYKERWICYFICYVQNIAEFWKLDPERTA